MCHNMSSKDRVRLSRRVMNLLVVLSRWKSHTTRHLRSVVHSGCFHTLNYNSITFMHCKYDCRSKQHPIRHHDAFAHRALAKMCHSNQHCWHFVTPILLITTQIQPNTGNTTTSITDVSLSLICFDSTMLVVVFVAVIVHKTVRFASTLQQWRNPNRIKMEWTNWNESAQITFRTCQQIVIE